MLVGIFTPLRYLLFLFLNYYLYYYITLAIKGSVAIG
jgi:hypothetical protein